MILRHFSPFRRLLTALPTVNAAFLTPGPTYTGQVVAPSQISQQETTFIMTATQTGDAGADTYGQVNYIDGVNGIGFTPSAVFAVRTGGTDTTPAIPISAVDLGGPITSIRVAVASGASGSGYAVGDQGYITGGNSNNGTYTVNSVVPTTIGGTTGGVANVTLSAAGTKYVTNAANATAATTGSGTGLVLNVKASSTGATVTYNAAPTSAGTVKLVLVALP